MTPEQERDAVFVAACDQWLAALRDANARLREMNAQLGCDRSDASDDEIA